jgi:hypothetical protein
MTEVNEQVIDLSCYSEHFLQNEDRGGQSVKPASRPEEAYRAPNSVWLRNLKGGGQGPIWAVEMDGCYQSTHISGVNYVRHFSYYCRYVLF